MPAESPGYQRPFPDDISFAIFAICFHRFRSVRTSPISAFSCENAISRMSRR